MKDIQQLIKKNSQEGRYEDIFPKTFIDAVLDKESGVTLTDILAMFNMLFLSYNGSRSQTRLQVPSSLRREGLWVTYVLYDKTVVTEWYGAEAIDDTSWGTESNWNPVIPIVQNTGNSTTSIMSQFAVTRAIELNYQTYRGTTAERPTLTSNQFGYQYFDSTLGKYICWNGNSWINLDGTPLD